MIKLVEEFNRERTWFRKVKILETYHLTSGNEVRDTARDLGKSVGFVSESLTLAKALDKFHNLHTMSRNAAIKFVRKNS